MVNIFILHHAVKLFHNMLYLPNPLFPQVLELKQWRVNLHKRHPPKRGRFGDPVNPTEENDSVNDTKRVHIPRGCLHPNLRFGTFRDSVRVLSSDIDVFYTWNQGIAKKKQRLLEIRTSIHFGNQWIFERPNFETSPKGDVHRATVLLSSSKFTKYEIWVPDFCLLSLQHVELIHTLFKKSTSGFTKKNAEIKSTYLTQVTRSSHPSPGDSIRDLLIPYLDVTYPIRLSPNHPKKVTKNCQALHYIHQATSFFSYFILYCPSESANLIRQLCLKVRPSPKCESRH